MPCTWTDPPSFIALEEPSARDAAYETEALIDHLFHHDNTAPFISHRLIQRFTSSNPSPRYIQTVATAFTTGQYAGADGPRLPPINSRDGYQRVLHKSVVDHVT
jgi:hypothetical protein